MPETRVVQGMKSNQHQNIPGGGSTAQNKTAVRALLYSANNLPQHLPGSMLTLYYSRENGAIIFFSVLLDCFLMQYNKVRKYSRTWLLPMSEATGCIQMLREY